MLTAIIKSIAFVALLFIGFIAWVCGLPFTFCSTDWQWRWRCFVLRHWARANAALLGMNLHTSGEAAKQPILLVSNHLSYLDVIVLASQCDAVFVAKSEIAHWPLLGFLSRCMGTIFINRGRRRDILRVNALIEAALCNGRSVIVFPEGTTSAGETVLPFKASLLEPAVKLNVPVQTASLHYATYAPMPSASESVCWWGEMDFVPHLWRLFQIEGFYAAVHFDATPLQPADRKSTAQQAWGRIASRVQSAQRRDAKFCVSTPTLRISTPEAVRTQA